MSALLEKLVKLAGMFGSDHDGERAAAAALADKLLRDNGLRWDDVLRAPKKARTYTDELDFIFDHFDLLDEWKQSFIESISQQSRPWSPRQREKVEEIIAWVIEALDAEEAA